MFVPVPFFVRTIATQTMEAASDVKLCCDVTGFIYSVVIVVKENRKEFAYQVGVRKLIR